MPINSGSTTKEFEELNGFFYDIVKKQIELNNSTNGEDWIFTNVCKKTNKTINWNRASWLEMAEFVESFDWKHWKKGVVDLENAKVELVDILHFMISQLLFDGYTSHNNSSQPSAERIDFLTKTIAHNLAVVFYNATKENITEDILDLADLFAKETAGKNYVEEIATVILAKMCVLLGMNAADIYKRYMIKNILNQFRQDNGYSTGTYVKIWMHIGEEKEDNIAALFIADKIISEGGTLSESLYESMDKAYASMA